MLQIIVFWTNQKIKIPQRLNHKMKMQWNSKIVKKICKIKILQKFLPLNYHQETRISLCDKFKIFWKKALLQPQVISSHFLVTQSLQAVFSWKAISPSRRKGGGGGVGHHDWCFSPGWERCAIALSCALTCHIKNACMVCCMPKTLYEVFIHLWFIHFLHFITLRTIALIKCSVCTYSTFYLLFS